MLSATVFEMRLLAQAIFYLTCHLGLFRNAFLPLYHDITVTNKNHWVA